MPDDFYQKDLRIVFIFLQAIIINSCYAPCHSCESRNDRVRNMSVYVCVSAAYKITRESWF